jgi:hypothetical protein
MPRPRNRLESRVEEAERLAVEVAEGGYHLYKQR